MKWLLILFPLSVLAADPLLPDPRITPGCITNIPIEILVKHGYTAIHGIRNVPEKVKRQAYINYGLVNTTGHYEVDHLISLELGGCNSIENLWPQSYLSFQYNAHTKDKLENKLASLVRNDFTKNGGISASNLLNQLQREISTNWIVCYEKYCGTNSLK